MPATNGGCTGAQIWRGATGKCPESVPIGVVSRRWLQRRRHARKVSAVHGFSRGQRDGDGEEEKEKRRCEGGKWRARVRRERLGARFKPGERGAGGGGGPGARWPCRRLSARPTVTRTGVGPSGQREKGREERGWAGWAAARCAPRGGRRLGRPTGWPGCLPRWLFFFFETFLFFFSGF